MHVKIILKSEFLLLAQFNYFRNAYLFSTLLDVITELN